MRRPDTVMVLAAGFGVRMGALTRDRPKPLLPLGARCLIDHVLDLAVDAGVRRAVVNLHYRGDQIREHLAARSEPLILFSEERPDILDTGGGMARARPLLGEDPVYVANSDAVFIGSNPFRALADAWSVIDCDALMLLVPRGKAHAHVRPGDFSLASSGVPVRRGAAPAAPLVHTGAQIMAPRALDGTPEGAFSMNLVWDRLLAAGRLRAVVHAGDWVDVGAPEGLAAARALLTEAAP